MQRENGTLSGGRRRTTDRQRRILAVVAVASVVIVVFSIKAASLNPRVVGDAPAIVGIAQGGTNQIAYRLRRPIPIFLDWALALGHRSWMPHAMIPIGLAGALLLIYVLAEWIEDIRPGKAYLAFTALAFPGTLATLAWSGPNTLGLALALLGWRKRDWRLLAAAGLIHETFLLFALHRRKVMPFIVYGTWAALVAWSYGFAFAANTFGFLSAFWAHQYTTWGLALALATLAIGCFALIDGELRWLTMMFLVVALCMGQEAWGWQSEFTRLLLPLWVFGFVAAARLTERSRVESA
jgi:hypothetical protein